MILVKEMKNVKDITREIADEVTTAFYVRYVRDLKNPREASFKEGMDVFKEILKSYGYEIDLNDRSYVQIEDDEDSGLRSFDFTLTDDYFISYITDCTREDNETVEDLIKNDICIGYWSVDDGCSQLLSREDENQF